MLLNFRSCAVFVFESDPRQLEKHRSKGIQFSSPLLSFPLPISREVEAERPILTDGYFRGGKPHCVNPIDLRIPVFLVRLFSRSFEFEEIGGSRE